MSQANARFAKTARALAQPHRSAGLAPPATPAVGKLSNEKSHPSTDRTRADAQPVAPVHVETGAPTQTNAPRAIGAVQLTVDRTTLASGAAWSDRKSGAAKYAASDFADGASTGVSVTDALWVLLMGLTFIATGAVVARSSSSLAPLDVSLMGEAWRLSGAELIAGGLALVFVLGLTVTMLLRARRTSRKRRLESLTVIPGTGNVTFRLGDKGLLIDGDHFLHFLEWPAVQNINVYEDKLVLLNAEGELVTIPKRFFDKDSNVSWEEARALVEAGCPTIKPTQMKKGAKRLQTSAA